jgi:A/G-specific adenine glycosylase
MATPAPTSDPAVATLIEWFAVDGADFPWRRTRDRYAVLVAEVQLQSTQAARVVPYFEAWMTRWPTACDLAAASLGDVLGAWQGLGYPRRARNLHLAARQICASGWPGDDRLTELPGVGPYTAAAIRCFADGVPVLPEDTNVARVLARRFPGGWPGTPTGAGWAVGQAFMDLGREWCTARAPRCESGCPLRDGCAAADAGLVLEVTPQRRRQSRFTGSLRQRRGILLGELTARGTVPIARDQDAAASLVADGLARAVGDELLLPEQS